MARIPNMRVGSSLGGQVKPPTDLRVKRTKCNRLLINFSCLNEELRENVLLSQAQPEALSLELS